MSATPRKRVTERPKGARSVQPLVRIGSCHFTDRNSADNNRVFLWESSPLPPFVRAVAGWKMVGWGKAPWPKADSDFAVMFEKQTPADHSYPGIKGEDHEEGSRIWHHFDPKFLRDANTQTQRTAKPDA